MIESLLLSIAKFAIGGGSGVVVGYANGWYLSEWYQWPYKRAALVGYAVGFFVNYGVNYLLGNIHV